MRRFILLLTAGMAVTLSGCAIFSDHATKEQMLVQSGFDARPANTAQRQALLAKMTPYQVELRRYRGSDYYIYSDPKNSVLYFGDKADYAAYQRLLTKYRVEQQIEMAQMQQADWTTMEWSTWGMTPPPPGMIVP